MKAMIFAAGLGTRLKPLTDSKPKALVEINGNPLLYYAIEKLKQNNCSSIIVNTHHFSNQIINYIKGQNFGIPIEISDETNSLLNTGGGLQNAQWFLNGDEPFLVYNVDIISDIDLKEMLIKHKTSGALVTLAVLNRKTSRYFLFDENDNLCGWRNKKDHSEIISKQSNTLSELAFSGIQIISPEYFSYVNKKGAFSIVDVYLELSKNHLIKAYNHTGNLWCDLGKIPELEKATHIINELF